MSSARTAIRSEVIDKMTDTERRELIAKIESSLDSGYEIEEAVFEEYVGEILWGRDDNLDDDGERA